MDEQQAITRDAMFDDLLSADPTFKPRWDSFVSDWEDEANPPLYIALGSLAEHLLDRFHRGDTNGFDRVFAVVERWHLAGDAYVSEAATFGLLEALQNLSGGSDRRTGTIEPWLGPESRRWWDKLDRAWSGDATALRFDN